MSRKLANPPKTKAADGKSLGRMLEGLHRARVETALDKISTLKEQLLYVASRAQHGHLSSSTAKALSLDLEQELTRTICRLEAWHLEMRSRV